MEIGSWGRMEKKVTENLETKELTGQVGSWIVHKDDDIIQNDGKSWHRVEAWEPRAKFWRTREIILCEDNYPLWVSRMTEKRRGESWQSLEYSINYHKQVEK